MPSFQEEVFRAFCFFRQVRPAFEINSNLQNFFDLGSNSLYPAGAPNPLTIDSLHATIPPKLAHFCFDHQWLSTAVQSQPEVAVFAALYSYSIHQIVFECASSCPRHIACAG